MELDSIAFVDQIYSNHKECTFVFTFPALVHIADVFQECAQKAPVV